MPSHQLLCFYKIFFYDLGKFLIRSASCKAHPFAKAFEMSSYVWSCCMNIAIVVVIQHNGRTTRILNENVKII